jgi:hypothetical protein
MIARLSFATLESIMEVWILRLSPHTLRLITPQVSIPHEPLVSDLLSAFLEYLRVEEGRASGTLARYASHLDRLV